ncbi:MAG: hypothetical protein ACTSPV_15440 [Candidatus Hodarchaeales archaeon]
MFSPKKEAEIIINVLFEEYGSIGVVPRRLPPIEDGKRAILWLKENNLPFGEVEWYAFFIKHYLRYLLEIKVPGRFENFQPRPKRYLIKGEYIWDIRSKSQPARSSWVILNDTKSLEELLQDYGGLGLIILNMIFEKDENNKFLEWHERIKGGKSKYTKQREKEGRRQRTRKTTFMIIDASVFYITKEILQKGIEEGWVDPSFQKTMRQQDGGVRNPKYIVDISRMTTKDRGYLFTRNFNYDPDDFAEDFPDDYYP